MTWTLIGQGPQGSPGSPGSTDYSGYDYYYERQSNGSYLVGRVTHGAAAPTSTPDGAVPVTAAQIRTPDRDIAGIPGTRDERGSIERTFLRRVGATLPEPTASSTLTSSTTGTGGEYRLNRLLTQARHDGSPGLNPAEADAYSRLVVPSGRSRERTISGYFPPTSGRDDTRTGSQRVETRSAEELRRDILTGAARYARSHHWTPQATYDNFVARGLIEPRIEGGRDVNRPGSDAGWTGPHAVDTSTWAVRAMPEGEVRSATTDLPTNPADVVDDTHRRRYLRSAHDRYMENASRSTADGGLGLSEADAEGRFNRRAEELGLMRRREDGSYEILPWNPESGDMNTPAQSFFTRDDGHGHSLAMRYNEDGSLRLDGDQPPQFHAESTVHGTGAATATDPVSRAHRAEIARDLAAETLYAHLTGELPEGSRMRIEHEGEGEGRRTFLVNPDVPEGDSSHRVEVQVVHPPRTREQALAYMQSRHLTDADGHALPSVNPNAFMREVRDISSGRLGADGIDYRTAQWERHEIARIMAGSPHRFTPQQITRFMNSEGWLGTDPSVDQMEAFRRRAAGISSAGPEASALHEEVMGANVEGNDPQEITERDRAADIEESLGTGHGSRRDDSAREGRAGREHASSEGRATRGTQIRVAELQATSQERIARLNREAQREADTRRMDHETQLQTRLQDQRLANESAEHARDRQNQAMLSLIQFLGSILQTAVQALTAAHQTHGQTLTGINQATFQGFRHS